METTHSLARPPLSIRRSFAILAIGIVIQIVGLAVQLAIPWGRNEWLSLLFYVAIMGSGAWVGCRLRGIRMAPTSFNLRAPPRALLVPLAAGSIALLFGVAAPISSAIPMSEEIRKTFADLVSQTGPGTFLMFVLAAPVLEEILFRGVILDGLLRRYSPVTAILVSSFLFGAAHLNPWQFVTGMVLGVFAGWVYLRSGSLLACIAIHMAANGAGFVMRFFMDPEAAMNAGNGLVESYGGPAALVSWIAACALVLVLSVRSLRRSFERLGPVDVLAARAAAPCSVASPAALQPSDPGQQS